MSRGTLRIHFGSAPGVGKTFAMLDEGRRRALRDTDVVVAFVECHKRPRTMAQLEGLEVLPRVKREYRGTTFEEMDLDGVLARHPQVALVDELAHTNVPGSRNEKRWQDVEEILAAGIDVITTVNVQHLESLNDVVRAITEVPQRETVPDAMVRSADQIEMTDVDPEALRRRMAHGNIYAAEKVDAALANYFRPGNLAALRELALLWLADRVDEGLQRYRAEHDITGVWEARERVVVALTGGPEGDTLIRRGARIAARGGAELLAVHVARVDGLTGADPAQLAAQRALVESLGGSYHQVVGENVPTALLDFARSENATQLVLGASRRSRWQKFLTGQGIGSTTLRNSGAIDVHLVTHTYAASGRGVRPRGGDVTVRRRLLGFATALVVLPVLALGLVTTRDTVSLASDVLLFLVAVVAIAMIGGIYPALLSAVAAVIVLNYFFTEPLHTLSVADRDDVLALVVFVSVASMVSSVVNVAARRTREAARSAAEAQTLATLAGSVLRGESALPALMAQVRETFNLEAVSLSEHSGGVWEEVAFSGTRSGTAADDRIPIDDDHALVVSGRTLAAADRRVLTAFAAQAAVALDQQRLSAEARAARPAVEADRTRTALLTAVSHDLRTPLAAATAAVASLRSGEVQWAPSERDELLGTADAALDRLGRLVANLLDMSRLQAGALSVFPQPVAVGDVVARAVDELGDAAAGVRIEVADDLPDVLADGPLLERVVVNLVGNALRHAHSPTPPMVLASTVAGRVEIRVVDRGAGVPHDQQEEIFAPFQQRGDTDNTTGVGLGLALCRGLTEAMSGTLTAEDTPGGGLTMTVALPVADGSDAPVPPGARETEERLHAPAPWEHS